MSSKRIIAYLIAVVFCTPAISWAQPTLPKIGTFTKNGVNVLTWINPYTEGIAAVSVQRSLDSLDNFYTIGYVKNTDQSKQTFIDSQPSVGSNWYQVVVSFTSGTQWTSNQVKINLDSAAIANRKPLPPNDSIENLVKKLSGLTPQQQVQKINNSNTYERSKYVFTNPFTGNIDINLPDAFEDDFELYFYNSSGKQVLVVPRINDTYIILDKRNFQTTGLFKFKLTKNGKAFTKGFVRIY